MVSKCSGWKFLNGVGGKISLSLTGTLGGVSQYLFILLHTNEITKITVHIAII